MSFSNPLGNARQLSVLFFDGHPEGGARRNSGFVGIRLCLRSGRSESRGRHISCRLNLRDTVLVRAPLARGLPCRREMPRDLGSADLRGRRQHCSPRRFLSKYAATAPPAGPRSKPRAGFPHPAGLSAGNQWYSADLVPRGDSDKGHGKARPDNWTSSGQVSERGVSKAVVCSIIASRIVAERIVADSNSASSGVDCSFMALEWGGRWRGSSRQ
jgi:hypothetical protein